MGVFHQLLGFDAPLDFFLQLLYPDSSEEAFAVIRGIQIIYFHLPAVRRGVDKLVVTNVDSHVSAISAPSKEDEIPFLQLVLFDLFPY